MPRDLGLIASYNSYRIFETGQSDNKKFGFFNTIKENTYQRIQQVVHSLRVAQKISQ